MFDRIPCSRMLEIALSLVVIAIMACSSGAKKDTSEPAAVAPTDAAPAAAPADAPAPRGPGVQLSIDHADAEIFLDGERIGLASDLAAGGFIALEAGIHQIAVRKPGFNTWRAEVSVRDKAETIQVTLEPAAGQ